MKSISKNLLLYFFVFYIFSILTIDSFLWVENNSKTLSAIKDKAHKTVVLAEQIFPKNQLRSFSKKAFSEKSRQIFKLTGLNIFLLNKDGKILSDSSATNNLLYEKDIQQAMKTGSGFASVIDKISGNKIYYYAEPIKFNGRVTGFIRVKILPEKFANKNAFVTQIIFPVSLLLFVIFLLFCLAYLYILVQISTLAKFFRFLSIKARLPLCKLKHLFLPIEPLWSSTKLSE